MRKTVPDHGAFGAGREDLQARHVDGYRLPHQLDEGV
jgi:hypothetical protein